MQALSFTSHAQQSQDAKVTEIMLSSMLGDPSDFVYPMLAHMSRQAKDKWFTWIAPHNITKEVVATFGFDTKKVRLIHSQCDLDTIKLMSQALQNGTSDTVVATITQLNDRDRYTIDTASLRSNTRGIILRTHP